MFINFKHRALNVLATSCLLTLLSSPVVANPEFNFGGFANITATYTGDDNVGFRTSLLNEGRNNFSFAPDTIIGLQTNIRFNDNIDFVGQALLQDRFDDHITNYLELAFLRYQINRNLETRIGRFSANGYLFTDSRYIGHALTWIRAPLEMYSVAGSLGNIDGIQANYTEEFGFGALKLGLSYGNKLTHNDDDSEGGRGEFRVNYDDLASVSLELQSLDWRFQAALTTGTFGEIRFQGSEQTRIIEELVPPFFVPFAREARINLLPEGERFTYVSVGGQVAFDATEVIAEFSSYESEWGLLASLDSGYVSVSHNIGYFTPYVVAAYSKRKEFPQAIDFERAQSLLPAELFGQLAVLVSGADFSIRANSISQTSISAGVRWDFTTDWSFKAQFDHIQFDEAGTGLFSVPGIQSVSGREESTNVLAIGLTTVF